jgi:hypothetical protein
MVAGKPYLLVLATPRAGATTKMSFVIPNKDPNGKKLDPLDAVMAELRKCAAGDLVRIKFTKSLSNNFISEFVKHVPKPGEDDPDAFVFVKAEKPKASDYQLVTLLRGDKTVVFTVPRSHDEKGKIVDDPAIMGEVTPLKTGDLVEIEVTGNVLKSLVKYALPVSARFVRLDATKIGNEDFTTVIVKTAGKEVALYIRNVSSGGGSIPSPELMGDVKDKFTPGQAVLYKAKVDFGTPWLTSIRADETGGPTTSTAPAAPASMPATAVSVKVPVIPAPTTAPATK